MLTSFFSLFIFQSGLEALENQPEIPESIVVVPLEQALQYLERFRDQCQGSYLQALREQVSIQENLDYILNKKIIVHFDW